MTPPSLAFVGAGPGDPELVTRRGRDRLAAAAVVVYDRPSLDGVAALAPAGAERVLVGRTREQPAWDNDAVVELLADRYARGLPVVRLKSGDLFVGARTSEETRGLAGRGVPFELVPGVSAAMTAPLSAGIGLGGTYSVVAGNDDPVYPTIGWDALARCGGTLVVLMGRAHQRHIAERLLAAGRRPDTPIAIVHGSTRSDEVVVNATLAELASLRLPPPATIIIADVTPGAAEPVWAAASPAGPVPASPPSADPLRTRVPDNREVAGAPA